MSITTALAHIATAEAKLAATTVAYPIWKRRADSGYYPDVRRTGWWQALDELAQAKADISALETTAARTAAAGLVYLHGDKEA